MARIDEARRAFTMRGTRLAAVTCLAAGAVALAGCSPQDATATASALTAASPTPEPTPTVLADRPAPADLVGRWHVTVAGDDRETWLDLHPDGAFSVWRDGGRVEGGWGGTDEVLIASWYSAQAGAGWTEPDFDVPWFDGLLDVERTADGWTLLTPDGDPLAVLTAADPSTTVPEYLGEPPLDPSATGPVAVPAPVPAPLEPATRESLLGRWVTPAEPPDGVGEAYEGWQAELVLTDDHRYVATDGCNPVRGSWVVAEGGRLLSTRGGGMTQMGCANIPVPTWLEHVERAAHDGEELVLLDRDGAELGRLTRG